VAGAKYYLLFAQSSLSKQFSGNTSNNVVGTLIVEIIKIIKSKVLGNILFLFRCGYISKSSTNRTATV